MFTGIIKWKGDKRPSWSKPGCDQWRFELRFDEYFHQVKSGVEKQYHGGSLIASYNFPNQENFILYGIDNPSTLFGTVFVIDVPDHWMPHPVGVYSFHFQHQANCWIDFSKSYHGHYHRHDGTKPMRKQFVDVEYDHETRRFSGKILWQEGPLSHNSRDTYKWEFEITFTSDLHQTIGFKELHFNRNGELLKTCVDSSRLLLYGLCHN